MFVNTALLQKMQLENEENIEVISQLILPFNWLTIATLLISTAAFTPLGSVIKSDY